MSGTGSTFDPGWVPQLYKFGVSLAQDEGSYPFAMVPAEGGLNDYTWVESVAFYNANPAAGLTSITVTTDSGLTLLDTTLLAALDGDNPLPAYTSPFLMRIAAGNINLNITGNGTGTGTLIMVCKVIGSLVDYVEI